MILISPSKEDHVLKRLRETGRGGDILGKDWLYSILHLLNRYVPDDWRLSKYKNAFVIRVLGQYPVTFVGESFRSPTRYDHIYHLISSVLPVGGRLIEALEDNESKLAASAPNLYIYDTEPAQLFLRTSPVAARQYEKRNPNNKSYEFHRLHLLDKQNVPALDPHRWVWIQWSMDGAVKIDVNPQEGWHGSDYWKLDEIINHDEEYKIRQHYGEAISSTRNLSYGD